MGSARRQERLLTLFVVSSCLAFVGQLCIGQMVGGDWGEQPPTIVAGVYVLLAVQVAGPVIGLITAVAIRKWSLVLLLTFLFVLFGGMAFAELAAMALSHGTLSM